MLDSIVRVEKCLIENIFENMLGLIQSIHLISKKHLQYIENDQFHEAHSAIVDDTKKLIEANLSKKGSIDDLYTFIRRLCKHISAV